MLRSGDCWLLAVLAGMMQWPWLVTGCALLAVQRKINGVFVQPEAEPQPASRVTRSAAAGSSGAGDAAGAGSEASRHSFESFRVFPRKQLDAGDKAIIKYCREKVSL